MNLPQTLHILLYGMPKNDKSNILNKRINREQYLHEIYVKYPFKSLINSAIIISLIIIVLITCYYLGISCVESGGLRNFINGGLL